MRYYNYKCLKCGVIIRTYTNPCYNCGITKHRKKIYQTRYIQCRIKITNKTTSKISNNIIRLWTIHNLNNYKNLLNLLKFIDKE